MNQVRCIPRNSITGSSLKVVSWSLDWPEPSEGLSSSDTVNITPEHICRNDINVTYCSHITALTTHGIDYIVKVQEKPVKFAITLDQRSRLALNDIDWGGVCDVTRGFLLRWVVERGGQPPRRRRWRRRGWASWWSWSTCDTQCGSTTAMLTRLRTWEALGDPHPRRPHPPAVLRLLQAPAVAGPWRGSERHSCHGCCTTAASGRSDAVLDRWKSNELASVELAPLRTLD